MSEYVVTVPKVLKPDKMEYNPPPSKTRIKPILGVCMPKNAHTHIMILHLFHVQIKKDRPTDPPNFQAKQTFYFC